MCRVRLDVVIPIGRGLEFDYKGVLDAILLLRSIQIVEFINDSVPYRSEVFCWGFARAPVTPPASYLYRL